MSKQDGFLLIGLLIVVVIIVLLMGGTWYYTLGQKEQKTHLEQGMQGIEDAQNLHKVFDAQNNALRKALP